MLSAIQTLALGQQYRPAPGTCAVRAALDSMPAEMRRAAELAMTTQSARQISQALAADGVALSVHTLHRHMADPARCAPTSCCTCHRDQAAQR